MAQTKFSHAGLHLDSNNRRPFYIMALLYILDHQAKSLIVRRSPLLEIPYTANAVSKKPHANKREQALNTYFAD